MGNRYRIESIREDWIWESRIILGGVISLRWGYVIGEKGEYYGNSSWVLIGILCVEDLLIRLG